MIPTESDLFRVVRDASQPCIQYTKYTIHSLKKAVIHEIHKIHDFFEYKKLQDNCDPLTRFDKISGLGRAKGTARVSLQGISPMSHYLKSTVGCAVNCRPNVTTGFAGSCGNRWGSGSAAI